VAFREQEGAFGFKKFLLKGQREKWDANVGMANVPEMTRRAIGRGEKKAFLVRSDSHGADLLDVKNFSKDNNLEAKKKIIRSLA